MLEKTILIGKLDAFFETGMEGVRWSIIDESKSYDNPHNSIFSVSDGDHLKVYFKDGEDFEQVVFDSIVVQTCESNRYGLKTLVGTQQTAGGLWCHSLQYGVDPDFWADMFKNSYSAELTKNAYTKEDIDKYVSTHKCTDNAVSLQQKVLNQCSVEIFDKQPSGFNNNFFLELTEEEIVSNDLNFYNAQRFMLKLSSIVRYSDFKHIFIISKNPLHGFQDAEYKIDSFLNDDDFSYFTNEIPITVKSDDDFLPQYVYDKFQDTTYWLNDEDVEEVNKSKLLHHKYNDDVFKNVIEKSRTFKFRCNGNKEYHYGAIIKFR